MPGKICFVDAVCWIALLNKQKAIECTENAINIVEKIGLLNEVMKAESQLSKILSS